MKKTVVGFRTARILPISFCLSAAMLVGARASDFYVDPSGQNGGGNNGSQLYPWQTVNYAIGHSAAGDTIHLTPGASFPGTVYVSPGAGGTAVAPKVITSSSTNRAIIAPATNTLQAVNVYNEGGMCFENVRFIGQGMDTNTTDGAACYANDARHAGLTFSNCEFTGFGNNGLSIGGGTGSNRGFTDVLVVDCTAHDNLACGINVWGQDVTAHTNVTIRRCTAYRNLGNPTNINACGHGIVVSSVSNGVIEYCTAYGNGARSQTTGGPVGIWTYLASCVTIQYCEAYSNRAMACDGDGFDIDGGAQNCTIQYCYSHNNDGAGYLICQYSGARAFTNNTVRYCISENDGQRRTGTTHGSLHFYSTGSSGGLQNTRIYNNTIFSSVAPAVDFQTTSGQTGTKIWNNIFVVTNGNALVTGTTSTNMAQFQNNCYWSSGGAFNVAGYSSLGAWRTIQNQETLGGVDTGWAMPPDLVSPGNGGTLGFGTPLSTLTAYQLQATSALIDQALDLNSLFGVAVGARYFYGNALPRRTRVIRHPQRRPTTTVQRFAWW